MTIRVLPLDRISMKQRLLRLYLLYILQSICLLGRCWLFYFYCDIFRKQRWTVMWKSGSLYIWLTLHRVNIYYIFTQKHTNQTGSNVQFVDLSTNSRNTVLDSSGSIFIKVKYPGINYPPPKAEGYCFGVVRLSVRLSVRPSVTLSVQSRFSVTTIHGISWNLKYNCIIILWWCTRKFRRDIISNSRVKSYVTVI